MINNQQEEAGLLQVAPFVHQEKYIVVHPGSGSSDRRWSPFYFATLADHCAKQGYRVVLTGTPNEAYIADYLAELMDQPVTNLAGKTSPEVMSALIKHADLLIASCTDVSQIAAATKTPGIIISMDGEPEALNEQLHHVFDWTKKRSFTEVHHTLVKWLDQKEIAALLPSWEG